MNTKVEEILKLAERRITDEDELKGDLKRYVGNCYYGFFVFADGRWAAIDGDTDGLPILVENDIDGDRELLSEIVEVGLLSPEAFQAWVDEGSEKTQENIEQIERKRLVELMTQYPDTVRVKLNEMNSTSGHSMNELMMRGGEAGR